MRAANLGARAVAVVIDAMAILIAFGPVIAIASGQFHHSGGSVSFQLHGGPAFILIGVALAYFTLFEAYWGTTPAKRTFGIYVVGPEGARPTLTQSAVRNVLRIVDGFPFFIPYLLGWIVALTNGDRRRIGDRAVGTRVVSRP